MRVLGLEPKTYGLKGHNTAHKYLSFLYLYAFFYVKKHYATIADSVQTVNRNRTKLRMTYR